MGIARKKSSKFSKVNIRTSSGNKIKYRLRKTKASRCSKCYTKLSGVLYTTNGNHSRFAKSVKIPNRPFGGNLCSGCMRNNFLEVARNMVR